MSGRRLRRNVELWANDNLGPEARSAFLARAARERLAAAQAEGIAPRAFTRFVDNVEGVPEEQVRPDGVILYRFRALANAAVFALAYLQGRSPVASGQFKRSFWVGVGGDEDGIGARFMYWGQFQPELVSGPVEAITIGNHAPYNRLVDVQMAGQRRVPFSVPADMYEEAARAVAQRFRGLRARRVYTRLFPDQYVLRTGPRKGKPVHSPALVISAR